MQDAPVAVSPSYLSWHMKDNECVGPEEDLVDRNVAHTHITESNYYLLGA